MGTAGEGVDMGADYVGRQMSFIDGLDPAGSSSLHRDLTTGHRMDWRRFTVSSSGVP
jgi:hypothetical protein